VEPSQFKREDEKMAKGKSRPKRWAEAIEKAQVELAAMQAACDAFESACEDLNEVRQEYEDWKDNLPENLQSSNLADKLSEVADLDIETAKDGVRTAVDEAVDLFETASGLDLPQGFGRD
jgi:chromosome segregation ATPase